MCYWVGTKKVREAMAKKFNSEPQDEIAQLFYQTFVAKSDIEFKEYYVAIGKNKPILTTLTVENGIKQFRNMQWTLPYSYVDSKTGSFTTRELLNSMSEKLFTHHKELIMNHRCILPINGYFEYYHLKGEIYPYYIYPASNELFYAGGIFERKINEETGEVSESFSIITTPPNPLTEKIHNNPKAPNGSKMLLLIKPERVPDYLNEKLSITEMKKLFLPYDEKLMKAHPVMRFQRKEYIEYLNTPKVLEHCDYPELVA